MVKLFSKNSHEKVGEHALENWPFSGDNKCLMNRISTRRSTINIDQTYAAFHYKLKFSIKKYFFLNFTTPLLHHTNTELSPHLTRPF